eukprot:8211173-Pyramimonas_sp.AAC.1
MIGSCSFRADGATGATTLLGRRSAKLASPRGLAVSGHHDGPRVLRSSRLSRSGRRPTGAVQLQGPGPGGGAK